MASFSLRLPFAIDTSCDPFSDQYFDQQVALYREIANREFDQETGELYPVPVEANVGSANPYGIDDVAFIAKHARAVLTTLHLADLPPRAAVLDLGCGWGLSTELIAFCGACVDAVDINPSFVELVERRTRMRNLPVNTLRSSFDAVSTGRTYDFVFFYECLHHAPRPWLSLERAAAQLKPTGKIGFAGEPVNSIWWPHWGLRLDGLSVYCIRKYGWFESGWSLEFLKACFARAQLELHVHHGVGLDDGIIGIAARETAAPVPQHLAPTDAPGIRPGLWVRLRSRLAYQKRRLAAFLLGGGADR